MEPGQAEERARRDELLQLYAQHRHLLGGFLFTICGDWEVVDDALQDVALVLCDRWREFTPGTNFLAWARAIARFCCLASWRRHRGAKRQVPDVGVELADESWQEAAVDHDELEALARCLDQLPPKERRVVEQAYLEGRPWAEIAATAGTRLDALYVALGRVRRRLRACIERRMAEAR